LPVPPETVQPPFGHVTEQLESPPQLTWQSPPGQSNVHVPVRQTNSQPRPPSAVHVFEQLSSHAHWPSPLQVVSSSSQATRPTNTATTATGMRRRTLDPMRPRMLPVVDRRGWDARDRTPGWTSSMLPVEQRPRRRLGSG